MDPDVGWRFMLGFGAIIPCLMLFLSLAVMPETPRYLLKKQKPQMADLNY